MTTNRIKPYFMSEWPSGVDEPLRVKHLVQALSGLDPEIRLGEQVTTGERAISCDQILRVARRLLDEGRCTRRVRVPVGEGVEAFSSLPGDDPDPTPGVAPRLAATG